MFHRWVKSKNSKKTFPLNYRKEILYDYREVDELIMKLYERGYSCDQIDEGSLGSGNWICVAPSEELYNYIITEVPLNTRSSAHTIKRRMKLTKADKAALAAAITR